MAILTSAILIQGLVVTRSASDTADQAFDDRSKHFEEGGGDWLVSYAECN